MSQTTHHLSLPYLMPAQAQKHVTHNEALRLLDQMLHISVPTRAGRAEPPAAPAEGERHLVAEGATGAFAGQDGRIASFVDGAWTFLEPAAGWTLHAGDEATLHVHDGQGFRPVAGTAGQEVAQWGVGAAPDAVNRLSVASPASLFSHAGGDHRMVVNKAAPADTASLVFQTGFSGRAEFGLAGEDAFSVKVSPDGAAWREALRADPATGALTAPQGIDFGGPSRLAHYEEGVFTPSLRGGTVAGNPTYVQAEGRFVRIGSLITVWARLIWSARGGIEGALTIHGLPYACRPGLVHRAPIGVAWYNRLTMGSAVTMLGGFVEPGAGHIRLWGATNPGTGINRLLAEDAIGESGEIYFHAAYLTAA
ncbi:DUF2793 domain-containing protein [Aureimonas populi]|uniref:DUF2793 domain-containing protein n=1 Tax=Aureimonas populi TaxID=1701758 RepID=A0ABW5CL38_9HYPH|nr:DUF2793 domain-containing protein [Aureimonas populi]